jgi:hypothetical protein
MLSFNNVSPLGIRTRRVPTGTAAHPRPAQYRDIAGSDRHRDKQSPLEAAMFKTTAALALAFIAATATASAANAGGVRVGFGFPLGSFVAHSAESLSGAEYRGMERRQRTVRRESYASAGKPSYQRTQKASVAQDTSSAPSAPVVRTAKLETKSEPRASETTVIEKTPVADNDTTSSVNGEKTEATADNGQDATTASNRVCRRYSATVGTLIEVPCE